MIENTLVYGGTSAFGSNRAKQMVDELDVLNDVIVNAYKKDLAKCESVNDVLDILYDMEVNNINIIGSRGYVYMTKCMADVIKEFRDCGSKENICYNSNLLTRALNLREVVCTLLLEELK